MTGSRAFASLSSALLARKGGARPAMRSPLNAAPELAALDDLGWNDMGQDNDPAQADVQPSALLPLARNLADPAEPLLASKPAPAAVVQPLPEPAGAPVAPLTAVLGRPVVRRSRPAAFTLRLEPDRHYRLRLACSRQARSAQALVTEALDHFLDGLSEHEPQGAPSGARRTASPHWILP